MAVLLGAIGLVSQMFSPYSDFQAMSVEQLKTLQVKLTFVGVQTRPTASVAFTTPFNALDLTGFVPFRRPGISYSNDDSAVKTFTTSAEELDAMIDNVGMLPNVTAGGVAADQYFSFALLNTVPNSKAFEAVLNKSDTADLFAKLRVSFASNKPGMRTLADLACILDVSELGTPADVSADADVVLSGVRLNRTTGRYVGTASVTNKSGQSLTGPVSLVLDLAASVRLFNADGTTCKITPVGREFINLPLTGNQLPPGATAQVTLEFDNPERLPVQATTKVLGGPGAR
jgi:hypothetical protein